VAEDGVEGGKPSFVMRITEDLRSQERVNKRESKRRRGGGNWGKKSTEQGGRDKDDQLIHAGPRGAQTKGRGGEGAKCADGETRVAVDYV